MDGNYTILIPAYNESHSIGRVLDEIGMPSSCAEVLVVDDGSDDATAEIASNHGARVIRHRRNRGYGASLRTGIEAVKTEYVVCCDADGQHRLEDLIRIAEEAPDYDMVVGMRERSSHRDWMRWPGKVILAIFANILTSQKIPDLNSGLRSFRVSVIRKYLHLMPPGFSFSTTSTIALLSMGYFVKYVPIVVKKRDGRKSTVRIFRDGMRVMLLLVNLTTLFNPLRVFLPVSLSLIVGSALYFVLYSWFVDVDVTPVMVMLFITGVLVFLLGAVCEQVSAIRRELHEER
ncbi:MAG: glycosyltransferase family 2 protein [Phycisphaerales bacterium]|nr:glycosyltransferase family 2 protein [Phycisphaerales bacterium]MCB9862496.1 glycosyltransferase family 2 protein [Phycisphaerales bacterium]